MHRLRRMVVAVLALSLSLGGMAVQPIAAQQVGAHAAHDGTAHDQTYVERYSDLAVKAADPADGLQAPLHDDACQKSCAACLTASLPIALAAPSRPMTGHQLVVGRFEVLVAHLPASEPEIPKSA